MVKIFIILYFERYVIVQVIGVTVEITLIEIFLKNKLISNLLQIKNMKAQLLLKWYT